MIECWRAYALQVNANTLNVNTYIRYPFDFQFVPIRIVGLVAGGYQNYKAWCLPDHQSGYPNNQYIRIAFYNGYTSAVVINASIYCFGYALNN